MNRASPDRQQPLSAEEAARALCELFLANADRGDNAGNDDLVAELVRRIRARQSPGRPREETCSHHPAPLVLSNGGTRDAAALTSEHGR